MSGSKLLRVRVKHSRFELSATFDLHKDPVFAGMWEAVKKTALGRQCGTRRQQKPSLKLETNPRNRSWRKRVPHSAARYFELLVLRTYRAGAGERVMSVDVGMSQRRHRA